MKENQKVQRSPKDFVRKVHHTERNNILASIESHPLAPAVTPNGRGDAIVSGPDGKPCFVTPLEERVPFSSFLNELCSKKREADEVSYASHQNGSFVTEYGPLAGDADVEIPWATKAFGEEPQLLQVAFLNTLDEFIVTTRAFFFLGFVHRVELCLFRGDEAVSGLTCKPVVLSTTNFEPAYDSCTLPPEWVKSKFS